MRGTECTWDSGGEVKRKYDFYGLLSRPFHKLRYPGGERIREQGGFEEARSILPAPCCSCL